MGSKPRNRIPPCSLVPLVLCLWLAMSSLASSQQAESPLKNVKWQQGPSLGDLGSIAEVHLPAGYVFAGGNDTRLIMEAMGNPPTGTELGFASPPSQDWFVVFEFDEIGYVRDDERNTLDANALLESVRRGTEAANKERRKRGWATLSIVGWEQPPRYNPETHNLEWAIRAESQGHFVLNHNTRLLGRRGVMKVTLVTDPSKYAQAVQESKALLVGYAFKKGHRYAEWVKGDKVAQYGLAALIVGGAGAVAVKSGLFKWLWKVLVVAGLGAAAFVKRLFGSKRTA